MIAASNLLFDLFGGRLVILPLVGIFGFALHGVTVHVFWTVRQRDYSPGLVTSVLYWIVAVVAHGGLNLKPGRTPLSASPVLKRAAANGDRTILGTPGQRVSATEIDSRPTTVL